MKVMLDTSVLVAAMVEAHPMHARAFPWMKRAHERGFELVVAGHSLAETYAVMSALPVSPRIGPGTAWRLIKDNVLSCASVVSLSAREYRLTLSRAAELGIAGGAVYDALIARAAGKAGVEKLVTFNGADFRRVAPEMASVIREP